MHTKYTTATNLNINTLDVTHTTLCVYMEERSKHGVNCPYETIWKNLEF